MSDGGEVLLRDKTVWRAGVAMLGGATLATLGIAGFVGWTLASTPVVDPAAWVGVVAPIVPASILASCTALFAVLRCTVTTEHVRVQFGLLGPTIPIDAITSFEVAPYQAMKWGGWGVRGLGKNVAYSTTGPGKGVQLVYMKNGAEHRVFVTSYDPESIVRAIVEAKARRSRPAATRVAADVGSDQAVDEEREDAAELKGKQSRPRS